MNASRGPSAGFTLLELVLTVVLLGIVAIVAVSSFTSGLTRTDIPVKQLQTDAQLQLVLENMIAEKERTYAANLVGFNTALGATDVSTDVYGNGWNYIITDKRFVCPVDNAFVTNTATNQFLLVTLQPASGENVSLTYIFSSNGAAANCNLSGGS